VWWIANLDSEEAMKGGGMVRAGQQWRWLREVSCRSAIGTAVALTGLAIAAAGASAVTLTVNAG
jgi:hypothetical protein